MTAQTVLLVLAAGLLVGVLSSLFGVGGGLLMVHFMVMVINETQHLAEGTSLLVIVPTAIVGVIAHLRNHFVSFRHALLVAIGGIGGAYLGADIALRIDPVTLTKVFGVFLAAIGIRTAYEGVKSLRA
ncbi:MAG: sulfite exporter TauE/SafE family protein [Actinobacteria bacterium]|nr:sulfite exporter TauE/SafE family protein [Actinomycetota bacterium]